MTQALDYERPIVRPPSRVLALFADVTTAYPVLLLGSLYGQWLLSWWILGHCPRPSLDDPKNIDGASWMHFSTYLALLGFVPAGCGAAVLNTLYLLNRRVRGPRLLLRIIIVVALWLGTIMLLQWDPGWVMYWWMD